MRAISTVCPESDGVSSLVPAGPHSSFIQVVMQNSSAVAFPLREYLKELFRNVFIHTCIYPCVTNHESRVQSALKIC